MRIIPDEVWAALTIWQESRGEPQDGRIAVGEVIRERMRRHYSSDGTVPGTVLRPHQFSGWNTNDPNRIVCAKLDDTNDEYDRCLAAWRASGYTTLVKGAVLYYNPAIIATPPTWAIPDKRVAIIGRHHFFLS